MKSSRALLLLLALLITATCLLLSGNYSAVKAQQGPFTPNQQLPLPSLAGQLPLRFVVRALEPATVVDEQGTIYVGSIRGVPGGADMHRWSPVVDGAPNADGTLPFVPLGQPDQCGINACDVVGVAEGGGDMYMATNTSVNGAAPNLAVTSQTVTPGQTSMHSGDRGNTFSSPNAVSNPIVGEDREWMVATGTNTVYMAVHDAVTFNINVFRSTDGGQNYTAGYGQGIDPQTFPAAGAVGAQASANIAGVVRIDRSSCSTQGNLYTVFVAPDSLTENAAGQTYRSVYVGVSDDAKDNDLVYTFTDHKVAAQAAGVSAANLFPSLAVDKMGYVYAVWSDNTNILLSVSSDSGTTWTAPRVVNSGSTAGKSNVFPWVDADANGHVVVTWYGADRAGNSNDTAVMEPCPTDITGAYTSTTCMAQWANWNVYFAETVNGHSSTPIWTQTLAGDHSNHRGTISTGGLTGSANRDMGDFFTVALDPKHRANIGYDDNHLLDPRDAVGTNPDDPNAARLMRTYFTRQTAANGAIVTGGSCAGTPPTVGNKLSGGGHIGQAVNFGVSIKDSPVNAALQYQDDNASLKVQSSNGARSVSFDGSCANASGDARVNGVLGYTYTVFACDNGSGGSSDSFSIQVTGPNFNYANSGSLSDGNLNKR